MLRQLRFDGYKLIHSRMLWIVYAVVFALALVIPIQEAALHNSVFSALTDVTPPVMLIQISVVLFAAFFVGADFRSGYIYPFENDIRFRILYTLDMPFSPFAARNHSDGWRRSRDRI